MKDLLRLTKAEIVLLEAITLTSGYLIGHPLEQAFSWGNFWSSLAGTSFLALGSGALNQIQEREEDAAMERTRDRPLPSGRIPLSRAIALVAVLFVAGSIILWSVSGSLLLLGALAVGSYNGLYTLWWKRKLAFAAIPGAIPGAMPILMGFQAAVFGNHEFDLGTSELNGMIGVDIRSSGADKRCEPEDPSEKLGQHVVRTSGDCRRVIRFHDQHSIAPPAQPIGPRRYVSLSLSL